MTASDDYSGNGSGSVTVQIEPGQSGRSIGDTLEKDGVVKTAGAFADAAAASPDAAGNPARHLHAAPQDERRGRAVLLLDPSSRVTDRVTVREGLRVTAVIALLQADRPAAQAPTRAALKDPPSIGLPALATGKAEGLLFPATYTFEPDTSATNSFRRWSRRR